MVTWGEQQRGDRFIGSEGGSLQLDPVQALWTWTSLSFYLLNYLLHCGNTVTGTP